MTDNPNQPAAIGLCCARIADIVFFHHMDRDRRNKLALELVELAKLIAGKAAAPPPAHDTIGDSDGNDGA